MLTALFTGTFTLAFTASYFAVHLNQNPNSSFFWWVCLILNAIPLWTFVAVISKNLARDAIIYDALLMFGFYLGYAIFSREYEQLKLTLTQWVGIGIILLGFITFKFGEYLRELS